MTSARATTIVRSTRSSCASSAASSSLSLKLRWVALLLAVSGAAAAQQPSGAQEAPGTPPAEELPGVRRGELGVRYWVSTATTRISHNAQGLDPDAGNPTSILTYENLDGHTLELFG